MRKNFKLSFFLLGIVGLLAFALPHHSMAAKNVKLKLASAMPSSMAIIGEGALEMTKKIGIASGGTLKVKFYDPHKLVPPFEIFDAVSKGAVPMGYTAAGFWVGKIPAAVFFTAIPFGPRIPEHLGWMYNGGGWELWKEIYKKHNLYPIPCGMVSPEASGWFRFELTDVKQLKGLKIRYPLLGGQVMQKLGASVQLIAPGEIYQAMERGVIDATELALPSVDRKLGFQKIAKHYYFPGWHQVSTFLELMINLDTWNGLSEQHKMIINLVCKDHTLTMIARAEAAQAEAIAAFRKDGVNLHYWSDDFLRIFKKATDDVMRENAAKDADFKRVYASWSAFRKSYAKDWGRLSRLPPGF